MNYVKLKTDDLSESPSIKNAVVKDNEIKSIELVLDGKKVLISPRWEQIELSIEKPDEIEDRWVVSGSDDIKEKAFDHEHDAQEFIKKFPEHNLTISNIKWNITKNIAA